MFFITYFPDNSLYQHCRLTGTGSQNILIPGINDPLLSGVYFTAMVLPPFFLHLIQSLFLIHILQFSHQICPKLPIKATDTAVTAIRTGITLGLLIRIQCNIPCKNLTSQLPDLMVT